MIMDLPPPAVTGAAHASPAPPGAAPSAASAPVPAAAYGPKLTGAAALFGLMLAQTVRQGGSAAQAAPAPAVAVAVNAVSPGLAGAGSTKGLGTVTVTKAKKHGQDLSALVVPPGLLPALTIITVVPNEPQTAAAPIGKVMDTSSFQSGELLSPPKLSATAPEAQTAVLLKPVQTNIIVPSETGSGSLSPSETAAMTVPPLPVLPAVPSFSTPSSKAVSAQSGAALGGIPVGLPVGGLQIVKPMMGHQSPPASPNAPLSATPPAATAAVTSVTASSEGGMSPLPASGSAKPGPKAASSLPSPGSLFSVPGQSSLITPSLAPSVSQTGTVHLLKQVSDTLQTAAVQTNGSGQRQLTLHLHPQELGQLRVSVTMTPTLQADGKIATQVVAHVVTEQASVKQALESNQADLRQTLKAAGLSLDRLTITVQPSSTGLQAGLGDGRQNARGGNDPWSGTHDFTGAGAQGGAFGGGHASPGAAFSQDHRSSGQTPADPNLTENQLPQTSSDQISQTRLARAGRVDTHA